MIVEDQVDRRVDRIGRIEYEEFDELAAAMTVSDQGMNLTGQQIDAGQQADCAVTLVFVVACEGGMDAGFGRQIGRRHCDRLDTGLLVVGDDCHRVARLLIRAGCRLLQELHLAINTQHLGHFFRKFRVALLQVVTHLVRLHLLLAEDLAQRALDQVGEAGVPLRRSVLACVAGKKPRRPQFVWIAQFLRLPVRQRRQPCLGFDRDRRLPTRARAIVQRRHGAFDRSPLNTALDCLGMQSERLAHCIKRGVLPVSQQNPRSLDRLAGSVRDCDIDLNFSKSALPSDSSIARRHAAITINPLLQRPQTTYREPETTDESPDYDNFHGIGRLVCMGTICLRRYLP